MAPCKRDFIETIIDYSFRYSLLFGLTTHLYDRSRHKLVYSPKAFCYSITLHVTQALLVPVVYIVTRGHRYEEKTKRSFLNQLLLAIIGFNFLAVVVSVGSQWTTRIKASRLFNEIIQMWNKDMVHLQSSVKIRRAAGRVLCLKTAATTLVTVTAAVGLFTGVDCSFIFLACNFYTFTLLNIMIAVQYQFCQGLIFGEYLFRILNHNLVRVVKDIKGLGGAHSTRYAHRLSKELLEIGRIHTKLQKWVVSFKNLYQLEFLFILTSFFVSQVCILFLLLRSSTLLWKGSDVNMPMQFLLAFGTTISSGVDMLLTFYACGGVISSCNAAGGILKDLPVQRLPSKRLERTIEMTCFELIREKIRLTICGLVDLSGNTGFALTQAAMMHIILLIQIDYDDF